MDKRNEVYTCNGTLSLKKEGKSAYATTGMIFKHIMLSEISPSLMGKYRLIPFT